MRYRVLRLVRKYSHIPYKYSKFFGKSKVFYKKSCFLWENCPKSPFFNKFPKPSTTSSLQNRITPKANAAQRKSAFTRKKNAYLAMPKSLVA
jgi:hypothetical protein